MLGMINIVNAQDTTKTTVTTTTTSTTPAAVAVTPQPAQPEPPVMYPQVGTHIGFKFQPTFTSLRSTGYDENSTEVNATVGYGYGASINYYFNNNFGTHFEVIYSELQQKYTDQENKNRRLDVSYFDIPILLSFNSDYGRKINFNVAVGPQLGILSGSKFSSSGGEETANVKAVVALKTVDVGLGYGAGIDFGMGGKHTSHINLGLRGIAGYSNTLGMYLGLMFKL